MTPYPPTSSTPGAAVPDIDAATRAALAGRRVLLVDDNPFNRQLAAQLLEDVGILVTSAEQGREALAALDADVEGTIDVVLMDCRMPVMDGLSATRQLRADPRWRGLPVIAMTASVLMEEHQEAREAGMDDHLVKPIDVGQLYATLSRWIGLRERQRGSAAGGTPMTVERLPGVDLRIGMARAMGSAALYDRLLRLFVQMHGNFEAAFRPGGATPDRAARRRLAHDLKSSAGTLGAMSLHALADALELACLDDVDEATVARLVDEVVRELNPLVAAIRALPPTA